jgi:hypothetical protein
MAVVAINGWYRERRFSHRAGELPARVNYGEPNRLMFLAIQNTNRSMHGKRRAHDVFLKLRFVDSRAISRNGGI